jgi:guanylate kinase
MDNEITHRLIVITGLACSGKDSIAKLLLTRLPDSDFIVTYADRNPRMGEVNGRDHYFITPKELDQKFKNSELVEPPAITGNSRKATAKSEFNKVLQENKNIIWRITPKLAAKVAEGSFFDENFPREQAEALKKSVKNFFIIAPDDILEKRKRERDKDKFDASNYRPRDIEDRLVLEKYGRFFNLINNDEGKLEEAVEQILDILGKK